MFNTNDDPLLTAQFDDNLRIEPEWYCPILPMVLVNGADGIGTGWSTRIPNFDIREIVANLKRMLDGDEPVTMVGGLCGQGLACNHFKICTLPFTLVCRMLFGGNFFFIVISNLVDMLQHFLCHLLEAEVTLGDHSSVVCLSIGLSVRMSDLSLHAFYFAITQTGLELRSLLLAKC